MNASCLGMSLFVISSLLTCFVVNRIRALVIAHANAFLPRIPKFLPSLSEGNFQRKPLRKREEQSTFFARRERERERRERQGRAESHGETRAFGPRDRGHGGRVAATFRAAEREEEREGKHRNGGERGSPGQAAAGGLGQGFRRVGQERPLPLGVELQVLSSQAEGALGEEEVGMDEDGHG